MKHEAWCSVESTWNIVKIITWKSFFIQVMYLSSKKIEFWKKCQTEIIMFQNEQLFSNKE